MFREVPGKVIKYTHGVEIPCTYVMPAYKITGVIPEREFVRKIMHFALVESDAKSIS